MVSVCVFLLPIPALARTWGCTTPPSRLPMASSSSDLLPSSSTALEPLHDITPRWTYDREAFLFLKKCGMGKYAKRISSTAHRLRYCQLRNLTLADCRELGVEKKDRKKLLRKCRQATGCKQERTCRVCEWEYAVTCARNSASYEHNFLDKDKTSKGHRTA